jgi:hypothetical protein
VLFAAAESVGDAAAESGAGASGAGIGARDTNDRAW